MFCAWISSTNNSLFSRLYKVHPPTWPSREPSDLNGFEADGPPWASLVLSATGWLSWGQASCLTVWLFDRESSEWTWWEQPLALQKNPRECLFWMVDVYYYCAIIYLMFVGFYMRTSHNMLSEDLASHTGRHAPYFFFATLAHTSFLRQDLRCCFHNVFCKFIGIFHWTTRFSSMQLNPEEESENTAARELLAYLPHLGYLLASSQWHYKNPFNRGLVNMCNGYALRLSLTVANELKNP
jgi:hypothetical protein